MYCVWMWYFYTVGLFLYWMNCTVLTTKLRNVTKRTNITELLTVVTSLNLKRLILTERNDSNEQKWCVLFTCSDKQINLFKANSTYCIYVCAYISFLMTDSNKDLWHGCIQRSQREGERTSLKRKGEYWFTSLGMLETTNWKQLVVPFSNR